ncbi:hypothetical protein [Mucilaginibacter antarcticus]|uniref:Uncharacterized protein n=1 Tax=Mucilaginibacter antarcticus TaxID=1855725 RepID=A0ABW5XNF9_9SPHI
MKIKEYIESGVLESYVLGSASEEETRELLRLKKQYPEVRDALFEVELDMERLAQHIAIPPPPNMLTRIEDGINGLIPSPEMLPEVKEANTGYKRHDNDKGNQFIEVESSSNHMRIHKAWRYAFAAVFVLGKIFLIGFIYYYLANKQAQEQIQQLKGEIQQYKSFR